MVAEAEEKIIQTLKSAADGLFIMSESDGPIEVLYWPNPDGVAADECFILEKAGKPEDTLVETYDLETAFTEVLNCYEEDRPRFDALKITVAECLSNVQVYLLGEIEIDVYIVGQTPAANFVALKSFLTQT